MKDRAAAFGVVGVVAAGAGGGAVVDAGGGLAVIGEGGVGVPTVWVRVMSVAECVATVEGMGMVEVRESTGLAKLPDMPLRLELRVSCGKT